MPAVSMALSIGSSLSRSSSRSRLSSRWKQQADEEPTVPKEKIEKIEEIDEIVIMGSKDLSLLGSLSTSDSTSKNDDDDDNDGQNTGSAGSVQSSTPGVITLPSVEDSSVTKNNNVAEAIEDQQTAATDPMMDGLVSNLSSLQVDKTSQFFDEGYKLAAKAEQEGDTIKAEAVKMLLMELAKVDQKIEATEEEDKDDVQSIIASIQDASILSDLTMITRRITFKSLLKNKNKNKNRSFKGFRFKKSRSTEIPKNILKLPEVVDFSILEEVEEDGEEEEEVREMPTVQEEKAMPTDTVEKSDSTTKTIHKSTIADEEVTTQIVEVEHDPSKSENVITATIAEEVTTQLVECPSKSENVITATIAEEVTTQLVEYPSISEIVISSTIQTQPLQQSPKQLTFIRVPSVRKQQEEQQRDDAANNVVESTNPESLLVDDDVEKRDDTTTTNVTHVSTQHKKGLWYWMRSHFEDFSDASECSSTCSSWGGNSRFGGYSPSIFA